MTAGAGGESLSQIEKPGRFQQFGPEPAFFSRGDSIQAILRPFVNSTSQMSPNGNMTMKKLPPFLRISAAWSLFVFLPACPLDANDWIYRRSYYSHGLPPEDAPQHPLPHHRSAYRPAYYREAQGFSIRSAYRINNYVIRSGPRTDRTIYQEGYVEFEP